MIGSTTRRGVFIGAAILTLTAGSAMAQEALDAPRPAQTPSELTPEQVEQMRQAMEQRRVNAQGTGEIIFINDHVDMGQVLDSDEAYGEYRFRNVGPGSVTIVRIKPDCGCTLASVHRVVIDEETGEEHLVELDPKEQSTMRFQEGEFGVIKTTYDAKNRWGPANKKINITTNNPKKPRLVTSLSVNVIPVVPVEPRVLTFGNNIFKGNVATRELKVYGRTDDFEALGATFQSMELQRNIDIEVLGTEPAEYKGEMLRATTIRLKTKAGLKPGPISDTLHVRTNDPRRPLVEVQVIGRVLGDLSITPPLMRFGRIGDAPVERKLQITSRSGQAFNISDIKTHSDAIDLDFTAEPGSEENPNTWVVYMRVTKTGVDVPGGRVTGRLFSIETDVEDEESLPINAFGVIQQ